MELYEQKEWAKIIIKHMDPHSPKNLRILRYRVHDFLFRKYGIEIEQLHRVALTKRSAADMVADHQISLWTNSVDDQDAAELEKFTESVNKSAEKRESSKLVKEEKKVCAKGRRTLRLESKYEPELPNILEEDNESQSAVSSHYQRYRVRMGESLS